MSDETQGRSEARDDLIFLYQENSKVTAIFLEWRHKVMTYWSAIIGAAIAGAGWFYQQCDLRRWLCVPLLLGAIFSLLAAFLDKRNSIILRECWRIGGEIEKQLVGTGRIFDFIGETRHQRFTYNKALSIAYPGVAFLLIALSILAVALIRSEPNGCDQPAQTPQTQRVGGGSGNLR